MRERVKEITEIHKVKSYTLYDNSIKDDKGHLDKEGFIDYKLLTSVLPTYDVAFDFCDPKPFMQSVYRYLKDFNVAETDIYFKFFGPAQEIAM